MFNVYLFYSYLKSDQSHLHECVLIELCSVVFITQIQVLGCLCELLLFLCFGLFGGEIIGGQICVTDIKYGGTDRLYSLSFTSNF